MDEAARAIAGLLNLEDALQLIVERVRSLVGSRYAALGIVDAEAVDETLSSVSVVMGRMVASRRSPTQ